MPFVESNNDNDKLQIYYELYGKDTSDTVVLIHPIGGNIEIWKDEISLISKKNLRIIAYDLRGHGRSNMGTQNSFTVSDLVQDLKILIDSLDIKKMYLNWSLYRWFYCILICCTKSTKIRSNNSY